MWVSLYREMEYEFSEERPHLRLDYNNPHALRLIANLFDKVVVDLSVLRFIDDKWKTLHGLLAKKPDSELVVESYTGITAINSNSSCRTVNYFPERAYYEEPIWDKLKFFEEEKKAFEGWKNLVGTAKANSLYQAFLDAKTPWERSEAIRMHNGSDEGLRLEFMRKILKAEKIEPPETRESHLHELHIRIKAYLETLFNDVTLHHEPYPYEVHDYGQGDPQFWVCRAPKNLNRAP